MLRRNELESWVERQSNDSEFQTEGALTLKAFADNASAVWGTGRRLRHSYISHTSWYTLHKIYYKPHHIRCNPFNIISSIQLIKTVNALQIKISIYENNTRSLATVYRHRWQWMSQWDLCRRPSRRDKAGAEWWCRSQRLGCCGPPTRSRQRNTSRRSALTDPSTARTWHLTAATNK